jgi:hypothetical protein
LHLGNTSFAFEIVQASSAHYQATERAKQTPNTVDLDRITGNLVWRVWGAPDVVAILADMCRKKITGEECVTRQKALPGGGDTTACFVFGETPAQCESWMNGSRVIVEHNYTCRATVPKF